MLFFIMLQRRQTLEALRQTWHWSKESLARNFHGFADSIVAQLENDPDIGLIWGSGADEAAWQKRALEKGLPYRDCMYIIDGFRIGMPVPVVGQRVYWDQYKHKHLVLFLVICDRLSGRVRRVIGPLFPGSTTEGGLFQTVPTPVSAKFLGDGAYYRDPRCCAPFPRDVFKRDDVTALQADVYLQANKLLRSQRVLIEQIFGDVRGQCGMLQTNTFLKKKNLDKLGNLLKAAFIVYNQLCVERGKYPVADFNPDEIPVEDDDVVDMLLL